MATLVELVKSSVGNNLQYVTTDDIVEKINEGARESIFHLSPDLIPEHNKVTEIKYIDSGYNVPSDAVKVLKIYKDDGLNFRYCEAYMIPLLKSQYSAHKAVSDDPIFYIQSSKIKILPTVSFDGISLNLVYLSLPSDVASNVSQGNSGWNSKVENLAIDYARGQVLGLEGFSLIQDFQSDISEVQGNLSGIYGDISSLTIELPDAITISSSYTISLAYSKGTIPVLSVGDVSISDIENVISQFANSIPPAISDYVSLTFSDSPSISSYPTISFSGISSITSYLPSDLSISAISWFDLSISAISDIDTFLPSDLGDINITLDTSISAVSIETLPTWESISELTFDAFSPTQTISEILNNYSLDADSISRYAISSFNFTTTDLDSIISSVSSIIDEIHDSISNEDFEKVKILESKLTGKMGQFNEELNKINGQLNAFVQNFDIKINKYRQDSELQINTYRGDVEKALNSYRAELEEWANIQRNKIDKFRAQWDKALTKYRAELEKWVNSHQERLSQAVQHVNYKLNKETQEWTLKINKYRSEVDKGLGAYRANVEKNINEYRAILENKLNEYRQRNIDYQQLQLSNQELKIRKAIERHTAEIERALKEWQAQAERIRNKNNDELNRVATELNKWNSQNQVGLGAFDREYRSYIEIWRQKIDNELNEFRAKLEKAMNKDRLELDKFQVDENNKINFMQLEIQKVTNQLTGEINKKTAEFETNFRKSVENWNENLSRLREKLNGAINKLQSGARKFEVGQNYINLSKQWIADFYKKIDMFNRGIIYERT